jgi:hypothetical protein
MPAPALAEHDLADLRSAGWIIQQDAPEDDCEGYYASISMPARTGMVRDCLAALDRHGVSPRWLSFCREEGAPALRRVALVTARCTAGHVIAAVNELAVESGQARIRPVRHVLRR